MAGLVAYGSSDEEDDELILEPATAEKVGASSKITVTPKVRITDSIGQATVNIPDSNSLANGIVSGRRPGS